MIVQVTCAALMLPSSLSSALHASAAFLEFVWRLLFGHHLVPHFRQRLRRIIQREGTHPHIVHHGRQSCHRHRLVAVLSSTIDWTALGLGEKPACRPCAVRPCPLPGPSSHGT